MKKPSVLSTGFFMPRKKHGTTMQPIHQLPQKLQDQTESVKSYLHNETNQWHFAIRLRHKQQICIGKGAHEKEARQDAEQRAIAYLNGAGLWADTQQEWAFPVALQALFAGKRITRSGWNGKDMWLAVSCPETRQVPAKGFWSPHNAAFADMNGGYATVTPCITLKNAQDQIVMGWIPSTGDLFATDWIIL